MQKKNTTAVTAPGRSVDPDENGPAASSVPRASPKAAARSCPYSHPDTTRPRCRSPKGRETEKNRGVNLGQNRACFVHSSGSGSIFLSHFSFQRMLFKSIWPDEFKLRLLTSSALFPGGD